MLKNHQHLNKLNCMLHKRIHTFVKNIHAGIFFVNICLVFKNRNCDEQLVNGAIQCVIAEKRSNKKKKEQTEEKPPSTASVVPFHPDNPPFQKVINEIWPKYQKHLNNSIALFVPKL